MGATSQGERETAPAAHRPGPGDIAAAGSGIPRRLAHGISRTIQDIGCEAAYNWLAPQETVARGYEVAQVLLDSPRSRDRELGASLLIRLQDAQTRLIRAIAALQQQGQLGPTPNTGPGISGEQAINILAEQGSTIHVGGAPHNRPQDSASGGDGTSNAT